MLRAIAIALLSLNIAPSADGQVRQEFLYNTKMPYGTLDIRTRISDTEFYYLQEGRTFSFRESVPGVRTTTYLDMTGWDSSPYKEGNLRKKDGSKDLFVMNYRLLPPVGYKSSYDPGYPMIVLMHGAVERANCYYDDCYHAGWDYDPNVNSPPAPTDARHELLNNDDHLNIGGKKHLDARNLAASRLPDDGSMPSRAFPGFVLVAQMMNDWDSLAVENLIRVVRLHCEKYNIDQNRIYIHGLSIGGYATYEAIKRAPWLFAAALPMSAVTEAGNIFKHRQQDQVSHIPLWIFQGGVDKEPTPAFTESVIDKFRSAGASVKYSLYPSANHFVWDSAYNEPEFFSWMLSQDKTKLHVRSGITHIDTNKNVLPMLMLAAGFFAYEWERDGVVIPGEKSHTLTVDLPGDYRARFSRVSGNPGSNDWNYWSPPVTITMDAVDDPGDPDEGPVTGIEDDAFGISVYPNPTRGQDINIDPGSLIGEDLTFEVVDMLGRVLFRQTYRVGERADALIKVSLPLEEGTYFLHLRTQGHEARRRVIFSRP